MAVENMTLAPFMASNRNPFNYAKVEQVTRDLATNWLTLDEITQQLNLFQDESQDSYLESLELATRMAIEDYIGLPIFPVQYKVYYPYFAFSNNALYLDLPEVSLVAILDADKEGFLRSERSLIQTIGRAARNLSGKAILYADRMTESMKKAIGETERRRTKQIAHNLEMGITPRGVFKQVRDLIDGVYSEKAGKEAQERELQRAAIEDMSERDVAKEIKRLEKLMMEHARNLEFENAARVRDQLATLREQAFGGAGHDNVAVLAQKA